MESLYTKKYPEKPETINILGRYGNGHLYSGINVNSCTIALNSYSEDEIQCILDGLDEGLNNALWRSKKRIKAETEARELAELKRLANKYPEFHIKNLIK